MLASDVSTCSVTGQTADCVGIVGSLVQLNSRSAVFELHGPDNGLRTSEVLPELQINVGSKVLYTGQAVVRKLVETGIATICEVSLDVGLLDDSASGLVGQPERLRREFQEFAAAWAKTYRILPEFKIVIADLNSYLVALKQWLEQVELGVRASPSSDRFALERSVIEVLAPEVVRGIAELFGRFEGVAQRIEPEYEAVHQSFARRQVHPLILSAPYVYRTYHKPLGYAGDYEMVNMMLRDPYEGSSLFAKVINTYALSLPPVVAHRNRIHYLATKLTEEAARLHSLGKRLRVMNLGCGPAWELQSFLAQCEVSGQADLTLLDLNDETLEHVGSALANARLRYGRATKIQLLKRSVQQLLKQAIKPGRGAEKYDMIYCAGLFDYLPNAVCHMLNDYLYEMLSPGGLLLFTNVDAHPNRLQMEYFLEWHLIYRDAHQTRKLAPRNAPPDSIAVRCENAGVNILVEVRKPLHS